MVADQRYIDDISSDYMTPDEGKNSETTEEQDDTVQNEKVQNDTEDVSALLTV